MEFVGRAAQLRLFDQLLDRSLRQWTLVITGPPGIGKTSLLRAMAARARAAGHSTAWLGDSTVADGSGDPAAVTFIDSWNARKTPMATARQRCGVAVFACRQPPSAPAGADVLEVSLPPLSPSEARELVAADGVVDPAAADRVLGVAHGHPGALRVATAMYLANGSVVTPRATAAVLRAVTDVVVDPDRLDCLVACAVARRTTRDLLDATVSDPAAAYHWLATSSFVETGPAGLLPDAAVRPPLLTCLTALEPMRVREVRRRLADYLYEKAAAGDRLAVLDLAYLIDDPVITACYGWDSADHYLVDHVRPDDDVVFGERLRAKGHGTWWERTRRYFTAAPHLVTVVRDHAMRPVGYVVAVDPRSGPDVDDPVIRPVLDHARSQDRDGRTIIWRDSVDLTDPVALPVLGMLNLSVALRGGVPNPRYGYVPVFDGDVSGTEFCARVGGRRIHRLAASVAGRMLSWHLIDYGPGGLIAAQRDAVYRGIGAEIPALGPDSAPDDVRRAFEDFADPAALAANPLARGLSTTGRAAYMRRLLRDAVAVALSDAPYGDQLQRILTARFFEGRGPHEAIARALTISRATYFRRLDDALDRVTRYLLSP